jgi:mannose-6-phosphate isomerase-like protein (cupin superfamily)
MAVPYYQAWMERQGIPCYRGYSVEDISRVPVEPWDLVGGHGALMQLEGMEGFTSCFLVEVAPGQQLAPQRHVFQQFVYVLRGHGRVVVRNPGQPDATAAFRAGDLFATPLNGQYVISNEGQEPLRYLSVNDAQAILDLYHHADDFVFDNPATFPQRMQPWPDYFEAQAVNTLDGGTVHVSNLIREVPLRGVDKHGGKGEGVDLTTFELAHQTWAGHIASWPVGSYHQAHHHMGGAVLLIVQSVGYTLMWPQSAGIRPFQAGHADQVVRVEWRPGTLFSPPTGWFHQHFNTGDVPARQLAFRGSEIYPSGIRRSANKMIGDRSAGYVSLRQGGNLIEPADEDPYIAEDYRARLAAQREGRTSLSTR